MCERGPSSRFSLASFGRGGMLFANRAGLARMVKSLDVGVPRLESGMPVGGELGYADELTLACAVEARSSL